MKAISGHTRPFSSLYCKIKPLKKNHVYIFPIPYFLYLVLVFSTVPMHFFFGDTPEEKKLFGKLLHTYFPY